MIIVTIVQCDLRLQAEMCFYETLSYFETFICGRAISFCRYAVTLNYARNNVSYASETFSQPKYVSLKKSAFHFYELSTTILVISI